MQDTSTPSPSDPEKTGDTGSSGGSQLPRKPLKLKRIVFEDTELHPHKSDKDEPIPEAQPYEEPEEAPIPEEFRKKPTEAHPPVDPVNPDAPVSEAGEDPDTEPEAPEAEPQPPTEMPVARQSIPSPEKPKASPLKRLAFILVPAAFIAVGLILLNILLDPFGADLAPIQPRSVPEIASPVTEEPPKPGSSTGLAVKDLPEKSETASLEAFITAFKDQPLVPSHSPVGLFVDSVFVPEGATLNPELGLVLSSVTIGDEESFALLRSASGETFPITILSGKK